MLPPVDGCAVILAAGCGTRMGGPKALMRVGKQMWCLLQAARLVREGVPAIWVISSEVRAALDPLPAARTLLDHSVPGDPDAPMFASVLAGIIAAHAHHGPAATSGVFVLPIDVPVPRRGVWTALIAAADVSVPVHRGVRGHPVFLPWPWILARGLAGPRTAAGDQRLDLLIGDSGRSVEVDDPDVVTNLNTPADLEAWRSKLPPEASEGVA